MNAAVDKTGRPLVPGDVVMMLCVILDVDNHEGYTNITVETIEPMHPTNNRTKIPLNSRQVERMPTGKSTVEIPIMTAAMFETHKS